MEAQKKAAEDSYNAQIKLLEDEKKALQDKIDKIKEENKDREEAIDLQKLQLNLAKAESQKTIRQYTKDRGFIYTTDGDAIRDAKNELDSAKSDAEIRKLEKQQDALDKQIDSIQEMLDASNEYWDAQIEQTEKYYDTIIKGMEEYKSRWEELSDLQEHAEMIALLQELGLTEEDLLNESSGAFDRLRTSYLGILKDLNTGNQGVLDGLSQLANVDMGNIPSFLAETQKYMESIADMDVTALTDGVNEVANGFSNIADSASNAASAISGGGSSGEGTGDEQPGKGTSSNTKNNAGTGSSLKDSIMELSTGSVEAINNIAHAFADEDGEGTSVTGAVQKVIDKVGSADSENGDSESLMSALTQQTAQALDEEEGIPAQKTAWEELNEPLGEAVESVTSLQARLEDMDGKEFTVTLNVIGNAAAMGIDMLGKFSTAHGGSGHSRVKGTAEVKGTANAQGNWGTKTGGRTLVGELGQEIWVHSSDGTFETVGDNGAEFIDIRPDDIIFNHLQTKQLLDKGNIVGRGKAYADGSALVNGNGNTSVVHAEQVSFLEYQERLEKCAAALGRSVDKLLNPATIIAHNMQEMMHSTVSNISNISNVNDNRNTQSINVGDIYITCPGVTSQEVAGNIGGELNRLFYGLSNDARQFSTKRK